MSLESASNKLYEVLLRVKREVDIHPDDQRFRALERDLEEVLHNIDCAE